MSDERRFGHMLQEYYVQRMRGMAAARAEALRAIRTPEQVRQRRAEVRRKLRASFGPLPERTPLNARLLGRVERPDYRIEKVLFESRPGLPVTGNLYVPRRAAAPLPGVLITCGHSANGKAYPTYQAVAQNFARMGYLVLIYDPFSQGERLQYPEYKNRVPVCGCCQEHNVMGNQMSLVGGFFGACRLWDGLRACDYLLSRPEIDRTRVGITGQSGGGTMSTYLTAFDDRFAMAAPSCFVTTYLRDLENELPADSEQLPPKIVALGLDHADFFIAQIPRPTILLGQENDFFDRRGLEETYAELKRLYALLGKADDLQLSIGPGDHNYSPHNRVAAYRFFNRHAGVSASTREPAAYRPEPDAVLQVTPKGQVHFLKARRLFDFTAEAARGLSARRTPLGAPALRAAVERRLQLPARRGEPPYRVLRVEPPPPDARRTRCPFAVETEPGILALLYAFPEHGMLQHLPAGRAATVYVPHQSASEEFDAGQAPASAPVLFAVEPRGIGQLASRACNDEEFFTPYGADYFYASNALMMNESYAGRRVHDLLCALDLLQANGYRRVHLVGRGLGALSAAFAAALHPLVTRVTLHNALLSYHELTQTPVPHWPLSALLPGVLEEFDLPDLYRLLRAKRLKLVAPWNARMQPWRPAALRAHSRALGIKIG